MARVAHTPTQGPAASADAALLQLALLPIAPDEHDGWSIEDEPMGAGWHDSSWMLSKGLEVIEGVTPNPLPAEWRHLWRFRYGLGYNTSEA